MKFAQMKHKLIVNLIAYVFLIFELCSCGGLIQPYHLMQLKKSKNTIQNLQYDEPLKSVVSQLGDVETKIESLLADGVTYKIILVPTDREHMYDFTYRDIYTPLTFKDDKLYGKSEDVYRKIQSIERNEKMLRAYGREEAELIRNERVVIGMSEGALIEIFNDRPGKSIVLELNTYSTNGSARAYTAYDTSRKHSQWILKYTFYVINGKLAKFNID